MPLRSGFDRNHELSSPIVLGAAVITADGSLRHAAVLADCAQWLEDLCKSAPIDCGEVQIPPEDEPDPGDDEAP